MTSGARRLLSSLGLRERLFLGLLAVLLLGGAAAVTVRTMLGAGLRDLRQVLATDAVVAHDAERLQHLVAQQSDAVRGYLLDTSDGSEKQRFLAVRAALPGLLDEMERVSDDERVDALVQHLRDLDARRFRPAQDAVLAAADAAQVEEARQAYYESYRPAEREVAQAAAELGSVAARRRTERLASAEASEAYARRVTLGALLGVLVLGVPLCAVLARRIARPMVRMAQAMERVSGGSLQDALPFDDRRDEVGRLSRSVNATFAYLRDLATVTDAVARGDLRVGPRPRGDDDALGRSVLGMSLHLRHMIGATKESAESVAGTAERILAASRRTLDHAQSEATAVRQARATAAELQETVEATEDRARETLGVMQRTASSGEAIRSRLGDATTIGQRLAQEFSTIAGSVQDLAQRNLQIGEIIEAVADVADQSQLLAVNAAIEAAKAGEYGVGFGVVAGEMRTLSIESKRAAQRVRDIVAEVQQAALRASAVVDRSQGRFGDLMTPVSEVLPQVERLTVEVDESYEAVQRILQVVIQQGTGIAQITDTMRAIDEAARHGLDSSRDLEQSAEELNTESATLRSTVAVYQL